MVWKNWSGRAWTFASIWGAIASMALEAGVGCFWVRDENEFTRLMLTLEGWNSREKHTTTTTRSRPKAKGWGVSTAVQQAHFLQGLPTIGPELAERIVETFDGLPLQWTASKLEMMRVHGVGKAKVEKMGEMIGWSEYEPEA